MALTQQEIEIVRKLKAQGKSNVDIAGYIGGSRLGDTKSESEDVNKVGLLKDFTGDVMQTGRGLMNIAKQTDTKIGEAAQASANGSQSGLRGMLQSIGLTFGGAAQGVGEVVKGGVKAVLPQETENALKSSVTRAVEPVVSTAMNVPVVQEFARRYESLDDNTKRDIDALLGTASLVTEIGTSGLVGRGAQVGKRAVAEGIDTATDIARQGIRQGSDVVGQTVKPLTGFADDALGVPKRLLSKAQTNLGEIKATNEAIKALPNKVAQDSVKMGVDIKDVNTLLKIPKEQKVVAKKLLESVKKFSQGKTNVRPEEIVGKPMTQALKRLEAKANAVGKKLSKVADNLGNVTRKEAETAVFDSLRKVNGLQGLKNNGGVLDFSDTVLGSTLASADQKAIQNLFFEAIAEGTGKQKHLLRQTLFEILGGKKSSLTDITATQESAYKAIRQGLSNVLDTKNPAYKALNKEYATISSPLRDLRKLLKATASTDGDILDMSGGLLARRLTSNAVSNPQIRQILRNIDKALKVKGKTLVNIESLQDLYNIFDRYYDISAPTGLKGQVKSAIEGGGDLTGRLFDKATALTRETPAVRQKALENLLEDLLSGKSNPVVGQTARSMSREATAPAVKTSSRIATKSDNLLAEAKKYKSAEEFVKAKLPKSIEDFSSMAKTGKMHKAPKISTPNISSTPVGIGIEEGYTMNDIARFYIERRGGFGKEMNTTKYSAIKTGYEDFVRDFNNETKSQLTDIWNKANSAR